MLVIRDKDLEYLYKMILDIKLHGKMIRNMAQAKKYKKMGNKLRSIISMAFSQLQRPIKMDSQLILNSLQKGSHLNQLLKKHTLIDIFTLFIFYNNLKIK